MSSFRWSLLGLRVVFIRCLRLRLLHRHNHSTYYDRSRKTPSEFIDKFGRLLYPTKLRWTSEIAAQATTFRVLNVYNKDEQQGGK